MPVLFWEANTWNLTLHMEFNLCNWQILQDIFLEYSLYFVVYWRLHTFTCRCKKNHTELLSVYKLCDAFRIQASSENIRADKLFCWTYKHWQSHLHIDLHMLWRLWLLQWLCQGFTYSQDMNLVSLGHGFHAPLRIMVHSAYRVHQSGKNRTAGSL